MKSRFHVPVIAALVLLATSSECHAKILLITRGETITHVGDIPTKARPQNLPANVSSVGFKYWYGGLFWIDFFTSDGEYCLYDGKEYFPISKTQAAQYLGIPENDVGSSFWYQFPPGWFLLGVIVIAVVVSKVRNRGKQKEIQELLNDPHYEQALLIFRNAVAEKAKPVAENDESAPPPSPQPWEDAIAYLVGQGIDKVEAEEKFGKVLAAAVSQVEGPQ